MKPERCLNCTQFQPKWRLQRSRSVPRQETEVQFALRIPPYKVSYLRSVDRVKNNRK